MNIFKCSLYTHTHTHTHAPPHTHTASGRSDATERAVVGRVLSVSHERDGNLNISPEMSYGVWSVIVTLQNHMLVIL